jgi:hypothetical protein
MNVVRHKDAYKGIKSLSSAWNIDTACGISYNRAIIVVEESHHG